MGNPLTHVAIFVTKTQKTWSIYFKAMYKSTFPKLLLSKYEHYNDNNIHHFSFLYFPDTLRLCVYTRHDTLQTSIQTTNKAPVMWDSGSSEASWSGKK